MTAALDAHHSEGCAAHQQLAVEARFLENFVDVSSIATQMPCKPYNRPFLTLQLLFYFLTDVHHKYSPIFGP